MDIEEIEQKEIKIYYSKSADGFYNSETHQDMPSDVIEIGKDEYEEFLQNQNLYTIIDGVINAKTQENIEAEIDNADIELTSAETIEVLIDLLKSNPITAQILEALATKTQDKIKAKKDKIKGA